MIEFIAAKELKEKFILKGRFYALETNTSIIKCRSLLTIENIRNITTNKKLLVIMLNPGSSRPVAKDYIERIVKIDKIGEIEKIPLTKIKPAPTQYQIMRIMNKHEFSSANIINLFDLRETKSKILFDKVKNGQIPDEISIFSNSRQKELENYVNQDITVILAWGKNISAIYAIEEKAVSKISSLTSNIFSVRGVDKKICHPNPQNQKLKEKWIQSIDDQINDSNK